MGITLTVQHRLETMINPSESIHIGTTPEEKTNYIRDCDVSESSTVQHPAVVLPPLKLPDADVKLFLRVHSSILAE